MNCKNTIMYVSWVVLLYLLGSLIAASFNIKEWTVFLRYFIAFFIFSLSLKYSESFHEN